MKLYLDRKNCKDFLDIVSSYSNEHSSVRRSAVYELLSYLRAHCEIQFLPLDDNENDSVHNKKYEDRDKLENQVEIDTKHRRSRCTGKITLKDKRQRIDKSKETTSFPSNNPVADNLRKWLTIGDTPYMELDEDDNIKKYISAYLAEGIYPEIKARNLSKFSVEKFLDGCLMENKFTTAKLKYTGKMKEWSSLINCTLPISEVIIVDPFLFYHKDKNIESTNKLINQLIGINKDVNITFVCNPPKLTEKGPEPNYSTIYESLHRCHSDCKFLFVLHNPSDIEENLHDRYIITNNGLYISGHSFVNYFPQEDSCCKAKGSIGFAMHSFLDHDNELVLRDIIDNNLSGILTNSIKGELVGDKFESDLLSLGDEEILSSKDWQDYWNTDLYEGKEETLQCIKKKSGSYIYQIPDCFFTTSDKEYKQDTLIEIYNITLNKHPDRQKFHAKFKIKEKHE